MPVSCNAYMIADIPNPTTTFRTTVLKKGESPIRETNQTQNSKTAWRMGQIIKMVGTIRSKTTKIPNKMVMAKKKTTILLNNGFFFPVCFGSRFYTAEFYNNFLIPSVCESKMFLFG